ncbi:MAG: response regulator [Candidatus Woesearchaeota archaeon]
MINIKNNNNIKDKIIDSLKDTEIGKSSMDLSKDISHNRLTISKYLQILEAQGIVRQTVVAQARLWKLVDEKEKPNILVVDDEPHVVNLVKLSLSEDKFNVLEAFSGVEALNQLKKNKVDLVVLDLMMPGMSGYEVCKIIKENPLTSHIHVIILSAKGEIKDKIGGLEFGADDYITKPFDPLELEARIDLSIKHSIVKNDKHPVTKLPAIDLIHEHIMDIVSNNDDFHLYNFHLDGLDRFIEKKGYTKFNELITLFSRLIYNRIMNKECFFGHTINNNFVVVSKCPELLGLDEDISKELNKMMPYLDSTNKNNLKLEINKISSKDIYKNNLSLEEISKLVNIS